MEDKLIGMAKSGIRSIFTVKKYNEETLDEDLHRIIFIRNLVETSVDYLKENFENIDVLAYNNNLKQYARELFQNSCIENIPEETRFEKNFNIEDEKKESDTYFNYIYENLEYAE